MPLLEVFALAKMRFLSHPDSIPRNKRWGVEGGGKEGTAPLEELQVPQPGQGMHPVPVLGAAAGKLPESRSPTPLRDLALPPFPLHLFIQRRAAEGQTESCLLGVPSRT